MVVKIGKLKKSAEFLLVSKRGQSKPMPGFILAWYKNPDFSDSSRVGYTVSRKVGNAVERNRVKRRLRAIVAAVFSEKSPNGFDFVIIGRQAALKIPYQNMLKDMEKLLKNLQN